MSKKLTIAQRRTLELAATDARGELKVLRWDLVWIRPLATATASPRHLAEALLLTTKIRNAERALARALRALEKESQT